MQGPYVDCSKPFKKTTVCAECAVKFKKGEAKEVVEVFDDPFAAKPRIVAFHTDNDEDAYGTCLDKMTDTSWANFRYFTCAHCERIVVRQCLSNGWRSYVKSYGGEEICVKCYQDIVLEDGHAHVAFEGGKIPGDFFNSSDLSANDWAQVPGYSHAFINGKETAKRFCTAALDLIEEGHKVLVDYNSMGIGGGEGYVSLYAKEANHG